MSWLFSQALVGEYSAASCSAGAQCAQLSVTPTPRLFWRNDKPIRFSRFSQFGVTLRRLTADRGEELLTWFRVDFLAKTYHPPASAQVSTEHDPACGSRWHESFAKYNPDMRSWRTPQCSLLAGLDEFSATWPRWGMMRNGACSEPMTAALRTSEIESGLWPTPKATDAHQGGLMSNIARDNPALPYAIAVMSWPTPRSNDSQKRGDFDAKNPRNGLPAAVKRERERERRIWPTPVACMSKGSSMKSLTRKNGKSRANDRLDHAVFAETFPTPCASDATKWNAMTKEERIAKGQQVRLGNHPSTSGNRVGGQLNPTWVEWLMGWPLGWTDLKPLETDKFQQWRRSHGEF